MATRRRRLAAVLGVAAVLGLIGPAVPQVAAAGSDRWREAVDTTWGQGLPTEQKLAIFDKFWTTIDQRFAAFQDLDVDWNALRARYRPEVAAGVSRGRFAGIM